MLRNIQLLGALLSLGVLSSLPVNAAIFQDITISGIFNSNPMSFTPSTPLDVTNGGAYEFSSVLPTREGANAKVSFDFDEYAGGLNLRAIVDGLSTSGFSLDPFSVTFTNIINSTPGSYFTSIQRLQDTDYVSSNGVYFSGVTVSNLVEDPLNVISFTLVFDGFQVAGYSRFVELELGYGNVNDNASVVPVPAAAPMALLGLGMLALARRFRRKNS